MRKVALALASVVALAGTSAAAETGIVDGSIGYTAGSGAVFPGGIGLEGSGATGVYFGLPEGRGSFSPGENANGSQYNSFVNIGATEVVFESSNATVNGPYNYFESFSTVAFDFDNQESGSVGFHSQITPQGLGMYLADTSGGCIFTNSCAQVSDVIHQFAELTSLGGLTTGFLGGVGFNFSITDSAASEPLYELSGYLYLTRNIGCDGLCIIDGLGTFPFSDGDFFIPGSGARSLSGFAMQTDPLDYSAIAFGWDATDIFMSLDPGLHHIEYNTSVVTFTSADCLGPYSEVCLVAYSGFGDPIGRGGGIDALSVLGDVNTNVHTGEGLIQGLNFSPSRFGLNYRNGELTYASGAVPEPASWALMIAGFGLLGAALRRRRVPALG